MNEWILKTLTDREAVMERLVKAGLSSSVVLDKANLFIMSTDRLLQKGITSDTPAVACFVPGRIEVLGKHTDYAGGRSLIAAAERGFCAVAVARDDCIVDMTDAQSGQGGSFEITPELVPTTRHWTNYPMTVARRLARNFPGELHGTTIAFASDLPPAAGMSSSSALVVMTFLLLSYVNTLPKRKQYTKHIRATVDLAGYLGTIENGQGFVELMEDRGVGTFGGSEDHTAILCSSAGMLGQFSYCPVRLERRVKLSNNYIFAIATSGVVAEKTGAAKEKYNRASRLATVAAELWRQSTGHDDPHLAAAITSASDPAERICNVLAAGHHREFQSTDLIRRFEHFYAESEEIIPAVADVFEGAAWAEFGNLVDRSQQLGAELLGNQVPETISLAAIARDLGATAASAFGAGFGGSVWALVQEQQIASFLVQWANRYGETFPHRVREAKFFSSHPGPAAFLFNDQARI